MSDPLTDACRCPSRFYDNLRFIAAGTSTQPPLREPNRPFREMVLFYGEFTPSTPTSRLPSNQAELVFASTLVKYSSKRPMPAGASCWR